MLRSAGLLATASVLAAALSCTPPAPRLPGADQLAGQVTIRRDTYGIPHILARTEEAAAFGFGYAQAEDHAAEIGRRYLAARGVAARYFGQSELSGDLAMAQFDNVAVAARALGDISPRYRRIISAYAAGVNRYTATHRAELPPWMPEITAADVLAYTRSSAAEALASPAIVQRLREKYEGKSPSSTLDERAEGFEGPGSNAFALSGSRTTTGKPILLGNPHLQWGSLYWEAHVRVPGTIDFYGSTLPGIPVLRAGFNDRLGFVTTNNAPDLDDIFVLRVDQAQPDNYLFDGESLPMRRRDVAVEVRNADGALRSERRTFWSSHIGPVVYRTPERAFAIRSTRLDAVEYYFGFHLLASARSLDEWRAALRQNYVPTSNFSYADVEGNILYVWNGRVPVRRDGVDYRLDIDAAGTADLWPRLHAVDDYPQVLNPSGGYVQNANNPPRFVSARDPIDMSAFPSHFERGNLALRPQLALDLLESARTFSVDDVIALKHSTRVLLAERVQADVIAAARAVDRSAPHAADALAGADALEGWDGRVSAGSRGAVLFQRFWELYSRAAAAVYAVPWNEAEFMSTPRGIGDRTAAALQLAAAVRAVREQFGSENVAWGEVHRFRAPGLDLPADGTTGTHGAYRVMTFDAAAAGDGRTRVAGHVPGRASPAGFGDAWILVVDFSRPATAFSVLAYGQTTNQASPHSRDQLPLFAAHRLRRAWFTEEDIKANLQRAYRP